MFNVQYYITKLEDLVEYTFPFTRIRQVEKQLDAAADDGEEEKKEEEKKTEELTPDQAAEETKSQVDTLMDKMKTPGKSIDLESIEEGELGAG